MPLSRNKGRVQWQLRLLWFRHPALYISVVASQIASFFQLDDRASMFARYFFSMAILVAVLILNFQHACTFTAEIIMILFIHWCGFIGLLYSTDVVLVSSTDEGLSRFGMGK